MKSITVWTIVIQIVFSLSVSQGVCQNSFFEAPTPPNASEFLRYGETPVNHASGLPSIEIPLHTLGGQHLAMPIGLSYHSGGIRVSQEATWVGLGWNLNAGGQITRTINDVPDEYPYGYNNHEVLERMTFENIYSTSENYGFEQYTFDKTQEADPNQAYDTQPDIFYFNCMGYSGKFIMRNDVFIPLSPDIFQVNYTGVNGFEFPAYDAFEIVTADGTKFVFGEYEETKYSKASSGVPPKVVVTSWVLTEVYNSYGELEFEITYADQPAYSTVSSVGESYSIFYYIVGDQSMFPSPGYTSSISTSQTYEKRIESIESDLYTVDFIVGVTDREDLANLQYPLAGIEVWSNENTTTPIKEYDFTYNYFNDGVIGTDYEVKRLKLESITMTDPLGGH